MDRVLTIGCPSDWATMPLRKELRKLAGRIDIVPADSSSAPSLIEENKLAVAPCSIATMMKNPHFEIAMPLGLAARSGTGWVLWAMAGGMGETSLFSELAPRIFTMRRLFANALAQQGRDLNQAARFIWSSLKEDLVKTKILFRYTNMPPASALLGRVLLRLLFGDAVYEDNESYNNGGSPIAEMGYRKVELLSGQDALQRRCQFMTVIDLVDLWEQITGLPFVFNVWMRYQEVFDTSIKAQIIKLAEFAQASMKVQPTGYFPDIIPAAANDQKIDLSNLWRGLSYRLGAQEMRGLLLFMNLARHLSKRHLEDDLFTVKMIRLQQRENEINYP